MGNRLLVCAAVIVAMAPVVAQADDPNDPAMKNPAALARDRAMTRQLNLRELARVRQRDARMFAAYDDSRASRSRDHAQDVADYDRSRRQYERDMGEWREAVAACRAGDYSACDRGR